MITFARILGIVFWVVGIFGLNNVLRMTTSIPSGDASAILGGNIANLQLMQEQALGLQICLAAMVIGTLIIGFCGVIDAINPVPPSKYEPEVA